MGLGPTPLPILVVFFLFVSFFIFSDGVGRQLLSFLGMVVREMGQGVSLTVSTLLRDQLGWGEVKKGPFPAAHTASSLLQKSCFRKTPGAFHLSRETKIGRAWPWPVQPTSLPHPHAESACTVVLLTCPALWLACPFQASSKAGPAQ